jgi:putative addiction module component (TIGR02574 family)
MDDVFMATPMTVEQEAMRMPPRRRLLLAEKLIASVDGFATRAIARAWNEEIERRLREIRSGKAKGLPADEVMATARRQLRETRRLSSSRRKRTG